MDRIIETDRLLLRPLTPGDACDVFEWVGDPIVNRFMPYSLYESPEQVRAWIASLGDKPEFGFVLKETGKLIGAGSVSFAQDMNAYELGYNLNRAYWGHGYATETSRAMLDWAYRRLGARDFIARHANDNVASGRVIQKCGFRFERYTQYARFDGSEVFDAALYSLHLD